METSMNILSKSFATGAFAVAMAAAAFTASMATSADAHRRHFRHAVHHCYNQSNHPVRCLNRVYNNGYGIGYSAGYGAPYTSSCGWKVFTKKKWNPAHTRLVIVKNRVWTCY
jgi:hypothetical protein